MGKIVMPKNSALLDEIKAVLKIYYEHNDWLSNDDYKDELKALIGDNQYSSSYTKKAQITSYFGFTIWEDINNPRSMRRITKSGIEMYEAILNNDVHRIQAILMNALETTKFGRNNFGCPDSDSDVEPPSVFIRASIDLGYLTYKEFAYLLWKLEDKGENYTDAIKDIKNHRINNDLVIGEEANKYTDCKPIMMLLRWGFLTEDSDDTTGGKHVSVDQYVLNNYKERLLNLKVYNIDMNINQKTRVSNPNAIKQKGGFNKIYYGAPGCGKSYLVNKELNDKNVAKENRIRVTFHPEFANCDFVGQILPTIEQRENETTHEMEEIVKYVFNPGPFTLALLQSYKTDSMVYLTIEEINRGNASAIFGDLFQLLDRKEDGESEYPICNPNIQKYLTDELKKEGIEVGEITELKIPTNLSIIATMNSSDQNVFTLDTAFKRRWQFVQISNDIKKDNNHEYKGWYVPGTNVTWETFLTKINDEIIKNRFKNQTNEDKRLGKYFVYKSCLTEKVEKIEDVKDIAQAFAYKILEYIWNDVCKIGKEDWFDVATYKTLEDLVDAFVNPDASKGETPLSVFYSINF